MLREFICPCGCEMLQATDTNPHDAYSQTFVCPSCGTKHVETFKDDIDISFEVKIRECLETA